MLLQVGRFLLKSLDQVQKGKPVAESATYFADVLKNNNSVDVKSEESLNCPYFMHSIFKSHSCGKLKALAEKFGKLIGQNFTQK